jgi:hypothetical protein
MRVVNLSRQPAATRRKRRVVGLTTAVACLALTVWIVRLAVALPSYPGRNAVAKCLARRLPVRKADRPAGRRRAGVPPTRHRARGQPTARAQA